MDLRAAKNSWRLMLVVNAAVMVGVLLYKLRLPPYVPYLHLLVDYHFGFAKRALIGAIVSLFTGKVPVWLVFALAGGIWLLTLALFIRLFRRTFGLDDKHLPLFVLMAGSPFFFKNFLFSLGHFDIYGCAAALGLLLIPAHSVFFVLVATLFSIILILIHHVHLLMYVPTMAAIVLVRHYLAEGVTRRSVAAGLAGALVIAALFLATQFSGTMPIPEAEFARYLQSKMADPASLNSAAYLSFSYIWYQPLSREISDTWARLPSNILGVPSFALLIWLHTPLWRYFADSIRALREPSHRRIVVAALAAVTLGYLVMFGIIFDYARWVSNWAVCMFLLLHAVKMLPVAREVEPVSTENRNTAIFGWLLTLIPRVGIIRPLPF